MGAQIINFRPQGEHQWTLQAACTGMDMFPADGDARGIRDAKAVCRGCPVRFECLTAALDNGEQFGVWGGLDANERSGVRRVESRRARDNGRDRLTSAELAADAIDDEADRLAAEAAERARLSEAERAEADRKARRAKALEDAANYGAMLDAASQQVDRVIYA